MNVRQAYSRSAGYMPKPMIPLPPDDVKQLATLTQHQLDLLTLLAKGYSFVEISVMKHVTVSTTKANFAHLLHRLDVTSRAEAIVIAAKSGLV